MSLCSIFICRRCIPQEDFNQTPLTVLFFVIPCLDKAPDCILRLKKKKPNCFLKRNSLANVHKVTVNHRAHLVANWTWDVNMSPKQSTFGLYEHITSTNAFLKQYSHMRVWLETTRLGSKPFEIYSSQSPPHYHQRPSGTVAVFRTPKGYSFTYSKCSTNNCGPLISQQLACELYGQSLQ